MSIHAVCKPGDGSKGLTRLPDLGKPLLQFNMLQEIDQLRRKESSVLRLEDGDKVVALSGMEPGFEV